MWTGSIGGRYTSGKPPSEICPSVTWIGSRTFALADTPGAKMTLVSDASTGPLKELRFFRSRT